MFSTSLTLLLLAYFPQSFSLSLDDQLAAYTRRGVYFNSAQDETTQDERATGGAIATDRSSEVGGCDVNNEWRPTLETWTSSVDAFIYERLIESNTTDFTSALVNDYTRGVDNFHCSPG